MTEAQARRRKVKFLEHFRVYGNVMAAATFAGINRRATVYGWQEHDDQFAAAFREAEIMATEQLEQEARRRAVEGVEKHRRVYDNRGNLIDEYTEQQYSDTLLIFLLKARAPEKYRERVGVEHSGSIGTIDSELDARIAARLAKVASRSEGAASLAT